MRAMTKLGCLVLSSLLVLSDRLKVTGNMLVRKRGRGEGSKETGLGACRVKPYKKTKNRKGTMRPLMYGLAGTSLTRPEEITE